jgi:hypothetical protein
MTVGWHSFTPNARPDPATAVRSRIKPSERVEVTEEVITPSRCSVCSQPAYRNRWGAMLMHTRLDPGFGLFGRPVICEGSDRGARP